MKERESKAPPVTLRDSWGTLKFQIKDRATRPAFFYFMWKYVEGMNKKRGQAVGLVCKFSTSGRRVTFSHTREMAYAVRTVRSGSIGCR